MKLEDGIIYQLIFLFTIMHFFEIQIINSIEMVYQNIIPTKTRPLFLHCFLIRRKTCVYQVFNTVFNAAFGGVLLKKMRLVPEIGH